MPTRGDISSRSCTCARGPVEVSAPVSVFIGVPGGGVRGLLVDLSVAVIVLTVAELFSKRPAFRIRGVTVLATCCPVSVEVSAPWHAVAVSIHRVVAVGFGGPRIDAAVVVCTVSRDRDESRRLAATEQGRTGVSIAVRIPVFVPCRCITGVVVYLAIAILVSVIAALLRLREDIGGSIVAVQPIADPSNSKTRDDDRQSTAVSIAIAICVSPGEDWGLDGDGSPFAVECGGDLIGRFNIWNGGIAGHQDQREN